MSELSSRRNFFKKTLGLVTLAAVAPQILGGAFSSTALADERRRSKPADAAGGDLALPLAEPGKGIAGNLNYQHKPTDVKDASMKVARQGVAWGAQHCNGCQFYAKAGSKDGVEVGKCTVIAGYLVKSTGWCTTWSKKS